MKAAEKSYHQSHLKLPFIGEAGLAFLQRSSVLVIGAGGLGCPCLQYLAGSGLGTLGIADFDVVDAGNLPRQTLYEFADIGRRKAGTAGMKLQQLNPMLNIEVHEVMVNASNIESLMSSYHLVVDATDNFDVRYLISDTAVKLARPVVYGAVHRSEGQVTVLNYNGSPHLRDLFPQQDEQVIASCADIGAFNMTTGIIGILMATQTIKICLQLDGILAGRLMTVDLLNNEFHSYGYLPAPASFPSQSSDRTLPHQEEIDFATLQDLQHSTGPPVLIDVRTLEERAHRNIGGMHIELAELLQQNEFDFNPPAFIVVYCESGQRSKIAANHLRQQGLDNVKSLAGGMRSVPR